MSKTKTDLLIIILNWNSAGDTANCIRSLQAQLQPGHHLLVVDNGSTDDSIPTLKQQFPRLEILGNARNLGFQGGMNAGIRIATQRGFKKVLLLNSDTIASPTMLAALLASTPSGAAISSPGIYDARRRDRLCSTGGRIHPILLECLRQEKPGSDLAPMRLEFLPSHAWLVDASVFSGTGLLDEMFFPIYYDDLDYCLRLKRRGFALYLLPAVKIYHNASVSVGGRNSPQERYLMARNSGYYFRKHMRCWQAPAIFLFRTGSALLWTLRLLSRGNGKAIRRYWQGFADGWFGRLPESRMG